MGLREYQRKRDFRKTSEPRGRLQRTGKKLSYLIQKHAASHLHYDFRLESDGVLLSWAVPKGPSLSPSQKRLAVHVEDHPIEYGTFEGTIPEGEYGGGTVMLWDRGTWEPIDDPKVGMKIGRLEFTIHGEKLHGRWMLVRRGGKNSGNTERNWFLFKIDDEYADKRKDITKTEPLSVATGRDLKEIAANGKVWKSNRSNHVSTRNADPTSSKAKVASHSKPKASSSFGKRKKSDQSSTVSNTLTEMLANAVAPKGKMPVRQEVQLAKLAKDAPDGEEWLHEVKFDGYRMLCRIANAKARFISRNGHDWTKRFPELATAAADFPVEEAMFDGEVVAVDESGLSHFQKLQNVFQTGQTEKLLYYVFDLLYLNGHNLKDLPLEKRKSIIETLFKSRVPAAIRYSEHLDGSGEMIFKEACRQHWEGIISKRRGSSYRPGRGLDWIKVKCSERAEFVIGGYTAPGGSREHFGALLLGYHDSTGKLIHAGRVGTGFNEMTLKSLHAKLRRLDRATSPFEHFPEKRAEAKGVQWVKPELVAEINFSNWTEDGLLRHPVFQGLREDKKARDVIHDIPISIAEIRQLEKKPPKRGAKR